MQILAGKSNQASAYLIAATLWAGFAALAGLLVMQAGSGAALNLPAVIGLLTLFVAATVAAFSLRYMRADLQSRRFYLGLGALVSSVLGWLFTGHLLVFAAFWCVSGQLLAGLIGHHHDWPEANLAARRTRWTFILGEGALVAALGLLGWQAGSWQLDVILASAAALSPLVVNLAALLMVAAAAARCALPPFSNWLLSSMTAPTPVSALMHAGLVNAGGFLLIRFAPVLEAAPTARIGAIILGLCAAIYGVGIMLVRPDVKRALAGSTISQMGFMIMSCGLGAYVAF
ncbi:MAG: proton-conducting transporter membrane subunit [Alphaproteobacteria bacterium]